MAIEDIRTKATVMLTLDIPWRIDADTIKQMVLDGIAETNTLIAAGAKCEVSVEPDSDE